MPSNDQTSDITRWASEDGHFRRQASVFRDTIEPNGAFPPEAGRYHLYVSFACPWAQRTLIVRKLKGLEDAIGVTIVSPLLGENGWPFANAAAFPQAEEDSLHPEFKHLKELYFQVNPEYKGRFTVPVLWDKKNETIVNNESSEIIRILNTSFDQFSASEVQRKLDLYPEPLRGEIDATNSWVYDTVNNGVYKAGFATIQNAYDVAVKRLFESLDRLEKIFSGDKNYLVGDQLTEADVRLYTTIVRFDPVYHGHFKCNLGSIRHDYPNINRWVKNLYWNNAAFKDTTNFSHIKTHYYWSHPQINPTRIVPLGPKVDIEPL
ncbi:glutathione S-transferase [Cantharellus anzutake]|uniref:glutathione S-transferase n=1 Tax=Cantharellus anzutake TaxID=1750568 RepID=UPI001902F2AD|nr:glutathione S-transferase [Cantharellus anzutake]KAF8342906.1 glutathione S-transferase [Cantharellus anzutake]